MTKNRKRLLAAIIVPAQVVLVVFAWRDLAGRPDDQVRGKRDFWRAAMLLQPGNSVLYWLCGRC